MEFSIEDMRTTYKKLLHRWNLINRNRDIIYKTKYDFKIRLDLSKNVDYAIYLGIFEDLIVTDFFKSIKPGMVIFDVGANIGYYSLIASKAIGSHGDIYSFEPSEWAFNRLRNNILQFGTELIHFYNCGVSDKVGKSSLKICDDDAYNTLGEESIHKILKTKEINLITLDQFVCDNDINDVHIIKSDTEGSEYNVFKGCPEILRNHKPKLYFENNPKLAKGFNYNIQELYSYLKDFNYVFYEFRNKKLTRVEDFNFKTQEIVAEVVRI